MSPYPKSTIFEIYCPPSQRNPTKLFNLHMKKSKVLVINSPKLAPPLLLPTLSFILPADYLSNIISLNSISDPYQSPPYLKMFMHLFSLNLFTLKLKTNLSLCLILNLLFFASSKMFSTNCVVIVVADVGMANFLWRSLLLFNHSLHSISCMPYLSQIKSFGFTLLALL